MAGPQKLNSPFVPNAAGGKDRNLSFAAYLGKLKSGHSICEHDILIVRTAVQGIPALEVMKLGDTEVRSSG